jgi:hypothetical protein
MYCGVNLTSNNCNCDKTIKPSKKNRTIQVPNFRNLAYKPDKTHEEIKKALLFANQNYGYKLDLALPYNCILCSACNSQLNRNIKAADKNKKFIIISSPIPTDNASSTPQASLSAPTLSSASALPTSSAPAPPTSSTPAPPLTSSSATSSSVIPVEFKLRMSIKQNKKVLPSVIVNFNLEDPNFIDFRNKFESYICEQVGLVYRNEYVLAYKSYSESGAGTLLGNEEAFDEFLKDYQSVVAGNRKMIIIVTLKESSKKHKHQVFIIF